jgi:hypothetical protein
MKRFLVCFLVLVTLAAPMSASARGGFGGSGEGICLGLGLGALFGLAMSQPQPVYVAPVRQPAMCLTLVPVWGMRWDPYSGRYVQVQVGERYVRMSCPPVY